MAGWLRGRWGRGSGFSGFPGAHPGVHIRLGWRGHGAGVARAWRGRGTGLSCAHSPDVHSTKPDASSQGSPLPRESSLGMEYCNDGLRIQGAQPLVHDLA
eukprot:gene25605-biopygen1468